MPRPVLERYADVEKHGGRNRGIASQSRAVSGFRTIRRIQGTQADGSSATTLIVFAKDSCYEGIDIAVPSESRPFVSGDQIPEPLLEQLHEGGRVEQMGVIQQGEEHVAHRLRALSHSSAQGTVGLGELGGGSDFSLLPLMLIVGLRIFHAVVCGVEGDGLCVDLGPSLGIPVAKDEVGTIRDGERRKARTPRGLVVDRLSLRVGESQPRIRLLRAAMAPDHLDRFQKLRLKLRMRSLNRGPGPLRGVHLGVHFSRFLMCFDACCCVGDVV